MSNCAAAGFDSDASPAGAGARLRVAAGTLARLARRALPQCCALCAAPCGDRIVCADCSAALPRVRAACPSCAVPSVGGVVCGACLAEAPSYATARAVFVYAFPVDRLLQRLKYGGALALADWAAEELAGALASTRTGLDPWPQALVPLPLAPARQRERGFNQAREIAVRLAARVRLPVLPALVRVRETTPQASLPWAARRRNVRGAFAARLAVPDRHLAIVDDVMTTGATLREAARALLGSGAASVAVWVVARTPPPASGAPT